MATIHSPKSLPILGRKKELESLTLCLELEKNVLLEGPVGVGKTSLVLHLLEKLGRKLIRIDGDHRYTEQKLVGWFDPPRAMTKGFDADAFLDGPLVEAMKTGSVLFVNELNRMPEGVQNVLLPPLDERQLVLPRLGVIHAKPGFLVIATQNPKEFIATSQLSEAIQDRFEWIRLDYPPYEEECAIAKSYLEAKGYQLSEAMLRRCMDLIRVSRTDPRIRRGASIRAALSLVELTAAWIKRGYTEDRALEEAALLVFPARLERDQDLDDEEASGPLSTEALIRDLLKKKPLT